ncbi:hypothetical protein GMLC_01620 [Geomonas limicola]|uniref:Uncharacterized protein n=1 Tax=Geomonas limicola TaxID=2740186 RepID=A0A6V8N4N6_9BACT|nr:hypothetical protein GMLC_01620 [Geomonas limicola]
MKVGGTGLAGKRGVVDGGRCVGRRIGRQHRLPDAAYQEQKQERRSNQPAQRYLTARFLKLTVARHDPLRLHERNQI